MNNTSIRQFAYLEAVAIISATVLLAFIANRLMPHTSLSLLFLTGVLIVASRTGVGPSLLASFISFLSFNFFFTKPYYTLKVSDEGDIATLIFFLIIAAITGNLAARMRQEIAKRKTSLKRVSDLYEFSRSLSSAVSSEAVLKALATHLNQTMERGIITFIKGDDGFSYFTTSAGKIHSPLPSIDKAYKHSTDTPVFIDQWTFLPLITREKTAAMVAIFGKLDLEQIDLARGFTEQVSIALDRTQLVSDLEQARLVSETEQLRSALLSSVSHDLRTPLASIIGSSTSLLEYGDAFSKENQKELLTTIAEEAQRLDRHIQNLLDMTRLGQGSLTLKRDWVDIHDIISSATDRMQNALKDISLDIQISPTVPLLWIHGVLIEQAVVNLLDNAIHFSPVGGSISITSKADNENFIIEVCDQGPGIPAEETEKIFDMFYTVRRGDRSNFQGTGLGLAICRGMVAAHNGTVTANDGYHGHGTCMRISLPLVKPD